MFVTSVAEQKYLFSAPAPSFFLVLASAPARFPALIATLKCTVLYNCSNKRNMSQWGKKLVFIHSGSLQSDFSSLNIYETEIFGVPVPYPKKFGSTGSGSATLLVAI